MAGAGPAPQMAGQVSSLSFLQRTLFLLSLLGLHAAANTINAGDSQFELSPASAWSTQGGALHTTQNGASATVNVGGTDFQVIGDVGPNRGKVQIQLDGQFFEVDTKNPTDVSSVVLWSGKALSTNHVFKVVVVQDDSDGKPVDVRKIDFTPDATDGSENAVNDGGQSSIFSSFTPGSAVATSAPPPPSSTSDTTTTTTSSFSSSSSSSSSSAAAAASSAAVSSAAQTTAGTDSVSSSAAAAAATSTSSSSSSGASDINGVLLPPSSSASSPAAANAGTAAGTSIPPSRSSTTIVAVAVAVPLGALLLGLGALFGYRRWSAQRRQRLEDDERRLSNFFTAGLRNGSSAASSRSSYPDTGAMRQVGAGGTSSFGGSRPASWYSESSAASSAAAPELGQDDLEALAAAGSSQRTSRVRSLGSIVRTKWPGAFKGFARGGDGG